MKNIGLLSDTHGWIYPGIFDFFKDCDEIWHAGDIGDLLTLEKLEAFKPIRAVYGNIDGRDIRLRCPEVLSFTCEGLKVCMKHIGGYPGRYERSALILLERGKPGLFIAGHSHILKIMNDHKRKLLYMNPGAAGKSGLHSLITCIRFRVEGGSVRDPEVLEKNRNTIIND
jgi:uncharacterized protein